MLQEKTLDIKLFPLPQDGEGNDVKDIELIDFLDVSKLSIQIIGLNKDDNNIFSDEEREQYIKIQKNFCNFQIELKMQEEPDNVNILSLTFEEKDMKYINFNYFDQSGSFSWDGYNNPRVGRIVGLKIKMPNTIIYNGQEIDFTDNNFDKINIYLRGYYLEDSLEEEGEFKSSDSIVSEEEPI